MNKEYTIKVKLDTFEDADVIEILNSMSQCNKLNKMVTKAVKKYCRTSGAEAEEIDEQSIVQKIKDIRIKQDFVYSETLKLISLSKLNKVIGIGQRAENGAIANFLLEKQMKRLQEQLGNFGKAYESDKVQNVEKIADEVVEFICENYQDIISEFKNSTQIERVVVKEDNIEQKIERAEATVSENVHKQSNSNVASSNVSSSNIEQKGTTKKVNSAEANGFEIEGNEDKDLAAALAMLGRR